MASPRAATAEYIYDDLGRLISVVYSNGTSFDYTYDDAGNRTLHTEDDTGQPFPPEFIVEGEANFEGENVTFTIKKIGTTSLTHNVDYATSGGTAIEGTDYTGKSGTLSFSSSETSKTVLVTTISDTEDEGTEDFFLDLSNPTNGALIGNGRASGFIADNTEPPPPSNNPPNAPNYTINMDKQTTTEECVTCGADPDGDPTIITGASTSGGGQVSISADQKKLIISSGPVGGITFTVDYTIEDDGGLSDSGVITVNVVQDEGCTGEFCQPY